MSIWLYSLLLYIRLLTSWMSLATVNASSFRCVGKRNKNKKKSMGFESTKKSEGANVVVVSCWAHRWSYHVVSFLGGNACTTRDSSILLTNETTDAFSCVSGCWASHEGKDFDSFLLLSCGVVSRTKSISFCQSKGTLRSERTSSRFGCVFCFGFLAFSLVQNANSYFWDVEKPLSNP